MAIAHSTARITLAGRAPVDTVDRVTIGRDVGALPGQVVEISDDPQLSKAHACIEIANGVPMVIDLRSTNGTFLIGANSRILVPCDHWIPVPPGAQLELGNQLALVDVVHHGSTPHAHADAPPPAPTSTTPSSGHRTTAVAAGIAVLVMLAVVAAGLFVLTGRGGETNANGTETVDESEPEPRVGDGRLGESARPTVDDLPVLADGPVAAQWSRASVGASEQTALVVDDLVYVSTIELGEATTVGLARADGTERWSSALTSSADEIDSVGAVDGIAFIEVCGDECSVFALESDGTQLWSASVRENGAIVTNSRLYFLTDAGAELIDPRSGDVVRAVEADFVTIELPRPAGIVDRGDTSEYTVYDFDLNAVLGPVRFDPDRFVFGDLHGASVVIAENGELSYLDGPSEVPTRTVTIDAGLAPFEVIAVQPDLVVIETLDETVHGLDTSGTVAVELWRYDGRVGLWDMVDTETGPVLINQPGVDGALFLDALTGEVRVDGNDEELVTATTAGSNAFGLVSFDFPLDTYELVIIDWATGRELLRQEFAGEVELVDGGGVIEVAADEIVYYE